MSLCHSKIKKLLTFFNIRKYAVQLIYLTRAHWAHILAKPYFKLLLNAGVDIVEFTIVLTKNVTDMYFCRFSYLTTFEKITTDLLNKRFVGFIWLLCGGEFLRHDAINLFWYIYNFSHLS